jgi:hypothetical protein
LEYNLPAAREGFAKLKVVRDRRIAIDLPVMIDGAPFNAPWPRLDSMFRRQSLAILISGPGDSGKTTLACEIGRRAAEGALGGTNFLPLFIDRDLDASDIGEGFLPYMAGLLRASTDIRRVSTAWTEALLRSGDILVIVDGLSERNEVTRRAFNPARAAFPIMRLVVSGRGDPDDSRMTSTIEVSAIPPDALYMFVDSYLMKGHVWPAKRLNRRFLLFFPVKRGNPVVWLWTMTEATFRLRPWRDTALSPMRSVAGGFGLDPGGLAWVSYFRAQKYRV